MRAQEHARFADLVVSLVNGTAEDCQAFLEDPAVPSRMLRALAILKRELDLINLQARVLARSRPPRPRHRRVPCSRLHFTMIRKQTAP